MLTSHSKFLPETSPLPTVPVICFILMKLEVLSPDPQRGYPDRPHGAQGNQKVNLKARTSKGHSDVCLQKEMYGGRELNPDKGTLMERKWSWFLSLKNPATPKKAMFAVEHALPSAFSLGIGWTRRLQVGAGSHCSLCHSPITALQLWSTGPITPSAHPGNLAEIFLVTSAALAGS